MVGGRFDGIPDMWQYILSLVALLLNRLLSDKQIFSCKGIVVATIGLHFPSASPSWSWLVIGHTAMVVGE